MFAALSIVQEEHVSKSSYFSITNSHASHIMEYKEVMGNG